MKDLSPLEAGRWMDAAPQIVQDAITSSATQQVLNGLSKKYSLHVDVSGLLEKLTSYVLLGYVRPEEFLKELIAAGISDKDAREIMTEINQKIFVSLRKEEEQGGMGGDIQAPVKPVVSTVPPRPAAPVVPSPRPIAPVVTAPRPAITSTADALLPVIVTSRPVVIAAPHIAPLPPKTVMPISSAATLGDVMRSILPIPVPEPKPVKKINLLEDHEESSPSLKVIQAAAPVAGTEPEMPKAPAVPSVPVNLPGAMPPYTIPTKVIPGPRPAAVVAPQISVVESHDEPMMPKPVFAPSLQPKPIEPATAPAPVAPYSSDPYREPIDEPVDEM